jgi:hypothetical protein
MVLGLCRSAAASDATAAPCTARVVEATELCREAKLRERKHQEKEAAEADRARDPADEY